MMKAFKKITFTLLVSSVLAFNGLALTGDNGQGKPKEKQPEQPKERDKPKGGGDERGGGKEDKKPKDKKPDGGFF